MISVLCVTKRELFTAPFLKLFSQLAKEIGGEYVEIVDGRETGVLEDILDDAIAECHGDYILRLDDDETVSGELALWLKSKEYEHGDLYAFPRQHLWRDTNHFIVTPPLWPDYQTRLSTKEKAGGRKEVHAGSPYGTGRIVDYPILHWKFLVRTKQEREKIAKRYESKRRGAGFSPVYQPFNLPEISFARLAVKEIE